MRRLLRPRPVSDIAPGSTLDSGDVADTEALIQLVGACRNYAGELALSEMTIRAYGELQQYLDTGTKQLLEALRHAGGSDRAFRQSQVDAAVRFCAKVFGRDYASLLTKAAEVAAQGAARPRPKAAADQIPGLTSAVISRAGGARIAMASVPVAWRILLSSCVGAGGHCNAR